MNGSELHRRFLRIISGEARGPVAGLARVLLSAAEPFYAGAAAARNRLYDARWLSVQQAARPVVSVGNLTVGGTGKTPTVSWLAEKLRAAGHAPAILARGYKSRKDGVGDEQKLLDSLLNRDGTAKIPIRAQPDRVAGAVTVIRDYPEIDVFILDDGFQHRRLHRDFELVLINATCPFGFDHVLPRGLLRERPWRLCAADAILVTRASRYSGALESSLRRFNAVAPIYRCDHVITGFFDDQAQPQVVDGRRAFSFAGIANPQGFHDQLSAASGASIVGSQWMADHYHYAASDVATLRQAAQALGAEVLITTEKDWIKIASLPGAQDAPPIWHTRLELRFVEDHEARLFEQIEQRVAGAH